MPLAEQVEQAVTFFTRLRGLMFRKHLPEGTGLYIAPCNSVHSCFMRFPCDVLFLDNGRRVVAMIEHMSPWRFSKIHRLAREVLELPAGTVERSGTQVGDAIQLSTHK